MRWFNGEIPDAIERSKSTQSIFIVYVEGQDDESKSMTETWANVSVTEACEKEHCVALKLSANSNECSMFNQLYPVVVVPSVYFIGHSGVPLEVTGGHKDPETFLATLKTVFETHKSQKAGTASAPQATPGQPPVPTPSPSSPSAPSAVAESSPTLGASPAPAAVSSSSPAPATDSAKPQTDSDADVEMPGPSNPGEATTSSPELEDKVARAKELLEEKRLAKEKQASEDAKEKERERRRLGRDVQKLKQFQEDARQKEIVDQLRKEREEDQRARERIREQIARDRAERAERFNKVKEEEEEKRRQAQIAKQQAQQQAAAEAEARRSEFARIQYKLPNGSTVTAQFAATDSLQTAYNYIRDYMRQEVSVATTFPSRTFTRADMSQTLASLQLAPSAVLMVLPAPSGVVSLSGGSSLLSSLFMAPINLVLFLWGLLKAFLFGGGAAASSGPARPSQGSSPGTSSPQATGGDRYQGQAQKRKSPGEFAKRDGKVHRISDVRDDDDEQNTWNGNSTQQM